MSITSEFDRAYRLHQEGKLREAFMRYDAVLAADPKNAAALHYSGVVLYQAGKIPEAAERIRASLQLQPASSEAWSNLALVLESAGRREAAVNALRKQFRDGVARNAPLLSPFVLLSQPSTRSEQRRCAENWTAQLAPALAPRAPISLNSGPRVASIRALCSVFDPSWMSSWRSGAGILSSSKKMRLSSSS